MSKGKRIGIALAVVLTAGWMVFDGAHALVTGDYVTPKSGAYAGQLGPWAAPLRLAGIEPRNTGVKIFFVAFGLTYLAALAAFLRNHRTGRFALGLCAVVTLLYLPFGTVLSAAVLAILGASIRQ